MRVIICGGRGYQGRDYMEKCLDKFHAKYKISMVIEGGAQGADNHGASWADNTGIPRVTCHSNWQKLGKGAGPVRNKTMLSLTPRAIIAFPGGKGTANMCMQAEKAGVKVFRCGWK